MFYFTQLGPSLLHGILYDIELYGRCKVTGCSIINQNILQWAYMSRFIHVEKKVPFVLIVIWKSPRFMVQKTMRNYVWINILLVHRISLSHICLLHGAFKAPSLTNLNADFLTQTLLAHAIRAWNLKIHPEMTSTKQSLRFLKQFVQLEILLWTAHTEIQLITFAHTGNFRGTFGRQLPLT